MGFEREPEPGRHSRCPALEGAPLLEPVVGVNQAPNGPQQLNLDLPNGGLFNDNFVADRCASFHAQGVEVVDTIDSDGSFVGNNNPGATVNFHNGFNIDTNGAATAFNATGGGGVKTGGAGPATRCRYVFLCSIPSGCCSAVCRWFAPCSNVGCCWAGCC